MRQWERLNLGTLGDLNISNNNSLFLKKKGISVENHE